MADPNAGSPRWQDELYDLLRRNGVSQFAYVPDAGHRILIDRSLDIGPLTWRGQPVGWESPSGFRHPAGHDPRRGLGAGSRATRRARATVERVFYA